MIYIILSAVIIISGIAAAAVYLSKIALHMDDAKPAGTLAEKKSEWEQLSRQYDASKGYEQQFAESDAYNLCSELLGLAKKGVADLEQERGTSLSFNVNLPGRQSFLDFNAPAWLKENVDMDDLQTIVRLADDVDRLGTGLEQLGDQACVAAYDSDNDIEKARCREMLSEAFGMLTPALKIQYSCPPEGGRAFHGTASLGRDEAAALAGMAPLYDKNKTGPRPNTQERRMALAKDGFRCRRCGRSPLSGGHIRPVYDKFENRYAALCENCAPRA